MNFSYGIIAAMGVLIAITLLLISMDPGYIEGEPTITEVDIPSITDVPSVAMITTVSLPLDSASLGCEKTNECFIPYNVSVGVGETVTWSNDDVAAHTVTSGLIENGPDGLFDSGLLPAGGIFEFTFEKAGEYDYYCIVHPWMLGKATVS